MSFDKVYPNRKDQRKPYKKSKVFDRTCRNHGSCPWCESGRLYKNKLDLFAAKEKMKER